MVKLRIERQKAKRSVRPPLFLIAGGPGQSATAAFDSGVVDSIVGTEARSRDIVVMDLRGTGRSGALDCPALQRGSTRAADVAACAAKLGPRRDFYTSVDMADDIDAVRAALGAERIAIYGASYGTYVAQVYARRHPTRVDRLVLDSVVGPTGVDAFARPSMLAVPGVVGNLCGKRFCRGFLADPSAAVSRLAMRLEQRPLRGLVTDRRGRRDPASIDGAGLLELAIASDLNPFVAAELPGAVRNALRGDGAPLLALRARAASAEVTTARLRSLSAAAYVATLCSDTVLPWSGTTPAVGRAAEADALIASLPAGAFAPFGPRTARGSYVLEACTAWPSSGVSQPALGTLPDVAALLLAGGLDVRTPVGEARAVAALLPRSELVTSRGAGHGVLAWGLDACAQGAVRRFLAGGRAGRCNGALRFLSVPRLPPPVALGALTPARGVGGRAGRTVTAVELTLVDAFRALVLDAFQGALSDEGPFGEPDTPVGALRGGVYRPLANGLVYQRASLVPGVRITGAVRAGARANSMRGTVRVNGPAAARGRLTLRRGALRGTLAGRDVNVRFRLARRVIDDIFGLLAPRLATARLARTVTGAR
jgi:pimeloyl-ACP methyl ester carboxylesterase